MARYQASSGTKLSAMRTLLSTGKPKLKSKATGLDNLPCEAMAENKAWLEVAMAAADLVCWSKLICFADEPAISRCEIEAFRYAILHMAWKLTRSARQVCLHLDRTWAWAKALERAFCCLRAELGAGVGTLPPHDHPGALRPGAAGRKWCNGRCQPRSPLLWASRGARAHAPVRPQQRCRPRRSRTVGSSRPPSA
jgi:hypothetical protein